MSYAESYILALDVGVGSVGWALIPSDFNQEFIIDGGSYIFQSASSNAERRGFRLIRRQYDHRQQRLKKLKLLLEQVFNVNCDFLDTSNPQSAKIDSRNFNDFEMSSVHWRAVAVQEHCEPWQLIKAIYHIAKNRGVRLTRDISANSNDSKDEKSKEKEAKSYKEMVKKTTEFLVNNNLTAGQLLEQNRREKKSVKSTKSDLKIFTRDQIKFELQAILGKQSQFYPHQLTQENIQLIMDSVFHEHPAQKTEDKIGKCFYNPNEQRLHKSSLIFQAKRIYEECNNLRIRDKRAGKLINGGILTLEQRNILVEALQTKKEIKQADITKLLGFQDNDNIEIAIKSTGKNKSDKEVKSIKGNETNYILTNHKIIGEQYKKLSDDAKEELIYQLTITEDLEELVVHLMENYQLNRDEAMLVSEISLPKKYGNLGKTATIQISEQLKKQVISNYEAVQLCPELQDTRAETGEIIDKLTPYNQTPALMAYCQERKNKKGEILSYSYPNPVVHKALNNIQKIVNEIIRNYGKPTEIAIEFARELSMSQEEREELIRTQNTNKGENDKARENGVKKSTFIKRKLMQMQGCICPYTGETITDEAINNGEIDIDHILPYSRTFMDNMGNKVACYKVANKHKGERSPFEAFSGGWEFKGKFRTYNQILTTIKEYPESKKRKFYENAMDKFADENKMLARFSTDTATIAKMARMYLLPLLSDKNKLRTMTGGITHHLRQIWGLDEILAKTGNDGKKIIAKNREDSRHHIVDAICIGYANHSIIQKVNSFRKTFESSREYFQILKEYREQGKLTAVLPYPKFRQVVKDFILSSRIDNKKPDLVVQARTPDLRAGLHKAENYRGYVYFPQEEKFLITKRMNLETDVKMVLMKNPMFKAKNPEQFDGNKFCDALLSCLGCNANDIAYILDENSWDILMANKNGKNNFNFSEQLVKPYQKNHTPIMTMMAKNPHEILSKTDNFACDMIGHFQRMLNFADYFISVFNSQIDGTPIEKLTKTINEITNQAKTANVKGSNAPFAQTHFRSYKLNGAEIIGKEKLTAKQRPKRLFETRSNDYMAVYEYFNGKNQKIILGWEVVKTIDAVRKDFKPKWTYLEQAKLIVKLRINDSFELTIENGDKIIARLQKASDGDITFTPVKVSTADIHPIRVSSLNKFVSHRITPITINPIGEIIHKRTINWDKYKG